MPLATGGTVSTVSTAIAIAFMCLIGAPARSQPAPADAVQAGFTALDHGDADTASTVFRRALSQHPRDPVLLYGAGIAAHLLGRERDALQLLQRALQFEPQLTQASALLGGIAYGEGDLDLAIKTYENALVHAPANMAIREQLNVWRSEAAVHQRYETLKDDRFTIMFDGAAQEKIAAHATATLWAAFWRIAKTLGSSPAAPITVIFYTQQQFHDITGAPEWAGGGFDGQIRIPLRGAAQNLPEFDRMLTHELTHAMLKSIAPRNVPVWLHEGLAMYFEGYDGARVERRLSASRVFVPLAALRTSFAGLDLVQAAVAYAESAFATHALLQRIGPGGLAVLLQDLDGGQTVEQAVERFGFTFAAFEADVARRTGGRATTPRR
jgi:tetratricopeptide (TPR) repeat protein